MTSIVLLLCRSQLPDRSSVTRRARPAAPAGVSAAFATGPDSRAPFNSRASAVAAAAVGGIPGPLATPTDPPAASGQGTAAASEGSGDCQSSDISSAQRFNSG